MAQAGLREEDPVGLRRELRGRGDRAVDVEQVRVVAERQLGREHRGAEARRTLRRPAHVAPAQERDRPLEVVGSALTVVLDHRRVIQVSVIGSGAEHVGRAEEVGRLLAERGAAVVTGGGGEVMAAAARGAKAAGGTTIAVRAR